MGTPKQLVFFGDSSFLTVAVEQALQVCLRCIVVIGANRERARAAIPSRPEVEEVHNPHYEDAMISAIALGARLVRSPRIQAVNATREAYSIGERKPKRFRGRVFNLYSTIAISSSGQTDGVLNVAFLR